MKALLYVFPALYLAAWPLQANPVIVTSQANYTFKGDVTYYVPNAVTLSGVTTFEGGAVIKYAVGASLNVTDINCLATPYRPVIFTAKDDGSVGQPVAGALNTPPSGTFYANPAIAYTGGIDVASGFLLDNFRIAYAQEAIWADGSSVYPTLRNGQIVNCSLCYYSPGQGGLYLRNMLFANFNVAFELYLNVVDAQNVTFDAQIQGPGNGYQPSFLLLPAGNDPNEMWVNLQNCILSHITMFSPANPSAVSGTSFNALYGCQSVSFGYVLEASPYQIKGAGNYYLVDFNDGTGPRRKGTSAIDGTLLTDLAVRTTYPPLNPPTPNLQQGTIWAPAVSRDNSTYNSGSPDLGYHYDPLDYWVSQYAVFGAPLLLENGVAVGLYGSSGFLIQGGAGLESVGLPTAMNRVVWYPGIQEQSIRVGNVNTCTSPIFNITSQGPGGPHLIYLNFTDLPSQGGQQPFFDFGSHVFFPYVTAKNCWFRGINLSVSPLGYQSGPPGSMISLWNSLLERCNLNFYNGYNLYYNNVYQDPLYVTLVNDLLWNCSVYLTFDQSQAQYQLGWTIQNNLFDSSAISFSGDGTYLNYVTRSNNGYHSDSGSGSLSGPGDVPVDTLNYAPGPLGPWYLGSSSPNSLVDAGSTSAEAAGLFSYTTQADQTEEACTTVDIGFHYVALDNSGNPQDNNFDGIPDYLQNLNTAATPQNVGPTCMNAPLGITLAGTSPCSSSLIYAYAQPRNGTVTGPAPNVTYTPRQNFVGSDSFTFTVNDGLYTSPPATVTITVSDTQPTANSQSFTMCENTTLDISLTGSSSCNEPLTAFNVVNSPSEGVLFGIPPNLTYIPFNNYVGNDSFTFTVTDGVLTSSPATITITVNGPLITAQPQSDTVCLGATATFSVTATGSSLSYQWRKDGGNLGDGGDISGSTTATLTVNPVAKSDVGTYDVIVTDSGCSVVSAPAYLAVGPYIIGQTMQQNVTPGSSASFSVTALGTGVLTYQWEQSTDGGASFQPLAGQTSSALTLSAVGPTQYGYEYKVQIGMPAGGCSTASLPATLTVPERVNDGAIKWIYRTTPEGSPAVTTIVDSSPAISSSTGTIYVHSTDTLTADSAAAPLPPAGGGEGGGPEQPSRLRALNPNGTEQWAFFLGAANDEITSSPSVAANSTVYATSHSRLLAVDSGGNQQWSLTLNNSDTDEGGAFSPAIWNGSIYADVDELGNFFGITPAGNLQWLANANNGVEGGSSPSVGPDGTIYFLCEAGVLVAVSQSGLIPWTFQSALTFDFGPSPTIGQDGIVYVGPQAINPPPQGSTTASQKWLFKTGGSPPTVLSSDSLGPADPLIAPNGVVYFVDVTGKLFALDRSTGSELWEADFGANSGPTSFSSPAVGADGTVYYGSGNGNLYAVLPPTQVGGQPTLKTALWPVHTGGPVLSSPAIGADGTVYVGSNDGNVYAVAGSTTLAPPSATEWPMFRKNLNHTAGY